MRALLPGLSYQIGILVAASAPYLEAVATRHFTFSQALGGVLVVVVFAGVTVIAAGPEARHVSFRARIRRKRFAHAVHHAESYEWNHDIFGQEHRSIPFQTVIYVQRGRKPMQEEREYKEVADRDGICADVGMGNRGRAAGFRHSKRRLRRLPEFRLMTPAYGEEA